MMATIKTPNLRPLDPTWWCRRGSNYEQQDGRGQRVRLKERAKTTGWALYIDGEYRGSWPRFGLAKRRAHELTRDETGPGNTQGES